MKGQALQRTTSDTAVLSSGRPVIIYSINIVSGGSAGKVILRNGTSTSGTALLHEVGVASAGKTHTYPSGIVFSSGCFLDVDANVSQTTVSFEALP